MAASSLSPQTDPARVKVSWLIRLRWVALLAQCLSIIPALKLGYLETDHFWFFCGTIFALAALNLFFTSFYRKKNTVGEMDLLCQLVIDVTGLTTLLMFSGGAWNPLSSLLFLHAGFGALLLTRARGVFFFLFIATCLAVLQWVPILPEAIRSQPTSRSVLFASYLIVAFVVWRLTAWLSKTLVSLQSHVTLLKDRRERMDRLRAIGALASGFSHEFATPLNTVKLRAERLLRKPEFAENADARVILEAVEQCERALKSFNDSRAQSSHLSLTQTDLPSLVEGITETWKVNHPECEITFKNELSKDDRLPLPQAAFSQIVLNLLDNALQSGADPVKMQIHFLREGTAVCFRVSDNGKGIPDIVFKQWGEPFVTTKKTGTGLGLFNALSLAQALGGDFKISNLSAGGARAEFCLPNDGNGASV